MQEKERIIIKNNKNKYYKYFYLLMKDTCRKYNKRKE